MRERTPCAGRLPRPVLEGGATSEELLDVRPILEKGGDPFRLIWNTVQELQAEVALHLVVGFEPAPLYEVMRSLGRSAFTEKRADAFHVWFFTGPSAPPKAAPAEHAPLQAAIELDVRGLEPPQPMITILEKLTELGPGAQLMVRHHREPVLLYDKLTARGYGAKCQAQADGSFLIRIAPRWALEAGASASR